MFGVLDTSTSGLVAQRTRLNVIAANVANQNSVYDADGNYNPFRRRLAVLAPGDTTTGNPDGVHVREIMVDQSPYIKKYQPSHPEADAQGYVNYPNVNSVVEQINALEASRAYEANITAAEATKSMLQSSLLLIA